MSARRGVSRGKTIGIILPPPKVDEFGVLRSASETYAGAFRRLGYHTVAIDLQDRNLQADLFALLRNPDVVAFHSEAGWGAKVYMRSEGRQVSAFEHYNKPFICNYPDFVFNPLVVDKLAQEFPQKFSFYNDRASVDLVGHFVKPLGVHRFSTPAWHDTHCNSARVAVPASERRIKLLYAGKHFDPEVIRERFSERHPDLARTFAVLVERGEFECLAPFWQLTATVLAEAGRPFEPSEPAVLDLMNSANNWIYSRRRRLLLERLVRLPAVIVTGSPFRHGDLHREARLLRFRPWAETLALFEQARAVVMSQPNHSDGITERLLTAMHRRAVVVSTTNNWIETTFAPGRQLLTFRADLSDLEEHIGRLEEPGFLDSLSAEAWSGVEHDFAPEAIVGRYLDCIREAGFEI
jgi:hypothetical protein